MAKAQIGGKAVVKVSGAVLTGAIAAANALSHEVTDAVSKTELGQKYVIHTSLFFIFFVCYLYLQ